MVLPPHAAELAAIEITYPVGIRPLPTFGFALRSLGSQACDADHTQVAARLSDLSLLASSQLWATRLLTVVHAPLRTGRPIVDAGTVVVMRIHIDR